MSSNEIQNSTESDNLCVVCFKAVEIYSIGSCDHAVCFDCSTRMRVLCKQNECPICRRELLKVVFTKQIEPFASLYASVETSNLEERNFGIIFCSRDIQKAYLRLLDHRCKICGDSLKWSFRTFQQLKNHMRREHDLYYCDICSENLKIFSFERKCYNKKDLSIHRKKGDIDNTSHRGHPICEFCKVRYMDNDELFRHLRKDHLFCHFCDADGKHEYYDLEDSLRKHFKQVHYLCEEGECKYVLLSAVFRTEIDLKAHVAQAHGKILGKSATKQARTLEFQFTLAPRLRNDNNIRTRMYDRRYDDDNFHQRREPTEPISNFVEPEPTTFVNPLAADQFPALNGSSEASNINLSSRSYMKFSSAAFNSNDFPTLGEASNRIAPAVTITAGPSCSVPSNRIAPNVTITRTLKNESNAAKLKNPFPALGPPTKSGSSTVRLSVNNVQQQTPKVSIEVNKNPNVVITTHITTTNTPSTSSQRNDSFPALGESVPSVSKQPQWVQPKQRKRPEKKEIKNDKPEPLDLNTFPKLSKSKRETVKKTSSVTVPVDSWVNLNSIKTTTKNKKESTNEVEKLVATNQDKNEIENKTDIVKSASNKGQSSKMTKETQLNEKKLINLTEDKLKLEDTKKSKKKKSKTNLEPQINEMKTTESTPINGMVKKRSELKVDNLNVVNENINLSAATMSKPPPGFTSKNCNGQNPVKPPPGFNNASFPTLNFYNDLTFTNSSGQSYAISPTNNNVYRQPHNFQNRNQTLIKKCMEVFNNNDNSIKGFKNVSEGFRKGDVDAAKYYKHCLETLNVKFKDLFPELLVLLPDISKQQELYEILDNDLKVKLVVCEKCKQIVFRNELSEHYNHHILDSHFPNLGTAQQINNAWNK